MKSIIDGKVYDTENASKIARWHNNLSINDFGWCEETLYRTQHGRYFLEGHGGPASPYAITIHACSSEGSAIIDLTEDDAFSWLAQHDFVELAVDYFPEKITPA